MRGGFVCILDLRRGCRSDSCFTSRFIVLAALLAFVISFAGMLPRNKPAEPLSLSAAATELADWESPTGFLLDAILPTAPPG